MYEFFFVDEIKRQMNVRALHFPGISFPTTDFSKLVTELRAVIIGTGVID